MYLYGTIWFKYFDEIYIYMETWLKRFGTSLNWPFNLSKKGKVSDPFGDYDGDGLQNLNDCKPKDPKKQDIQGSIAMGAAGQQMAAITQQQPRQIKPQEEVVLEGFPPHVHAQSARSKPIHRLKTATEMRGPMGKSTETMMPSKINQNTNPTIPSQ